ncbi:MAG: hypothetical protein AVDCRST_MAG77-3939, partial [uncultured Chloroflexi bacterium]
GNTSTGHRAADPCAASDSGGTAGAAGETGHVRGVAAHRRARRAYRRLAGATRGRPAPSGAARGSRGGGRVRWLPQPWLRPAPRRL